VTSRARINVASTQANNFRLWSVVKPTPGRTMAPTALDESLFLNQLLQGLDDDFFCAVPSPDPSPVKPKPLQLKLTLPSTPTKKPKPSLPLVASNLPSASDYDASSFLQGSENWDLDDFSISPVKPRSSKLKVYLNIYESILKFLLSVEYVGYYISGTS